MRFSALIGFKDDIFAAEAYASAITAQTLVPETVDVAIHRDTVAMSSPFPRWAEPISFRIPALRRNARSVAAHPGRGSSLWNRCGGWSQSCCLDSDRATFISEQNKNPGPSGEDADDVGKPRDVG
ncbi:hypothetical protein [Bradyrhizobium liaoningense]